MVVVAGIVSPSVVRPKVRVSMGYLDDGGHLKPERRRTRLSCSPVPMRVGRRAGATGGHGQPMPTSSASTPPPDPDDEEAVPLSVWPCAQTTAQRQRAGVYLPECREHPGKMLPDLARRIIRAYSRRGDLVVDPMCGSGTTIVEAARLHRRAVGVDVEARWVDLTRANLDHVLDDTTRALGDVRVGDARQLPAVLADVAGRVIWWRRGRRTRARSA